MTLEQQVVSLPIAKRLKELGCKQESHFRWMNHGHPAGWEICTANGSSKGIAAYTCSELGEMLPSEITGRFLVSAKANDRSWAVYYEDNVLGAEIGDEMILDQSAATEADARGKMLIYLLEQKLITL